MPSKIHIHVSNNRAFVWNIEDLVTLRSSHRICGLLVGTLPHLSQQNVFLGVPLILLPEEAVLLVEKGFAVFIDDPGAHNTPTPQQLLYWAEKRDEEVQKQIARVGDTKEDVAASKGMTDAAVQKRRERETKRAAAAKEKAAAEGINSEEVFETPAQNQDVIQTNTSTSIHAVTIPTTSVDLPWYDANGHSYDSITAAKDAGIWTYPANLHERAKCGVFLHLWEQGYYMGGGMRFGGDYLVYPGDPLRYHSHFVASVVDSPTSTLLPMEIVAHGRLGTATKKAHLLCSWDDETKEVSYHSIEWAGFG